MIFCVALSCEGPGSGRFRGTACRACVDCDVRPDSPPSTAPHRQSAVVTEQRKQYLFGRLSVTPRGGVLYCGRRSEKDKTHWRPRIFEFCRSTCARRAAERACNSLLNKRFGRSRSSVRHAGVPHICDKTRAFCTGPCTERPRKPGSHVRADVQKPVAFCRVWYERAKSQERRVESSERRTDD